MECDLVRTYEKNSSYVRAHFCSSRLSVPWTICLPWPINLKQYWPADSRHYFRNTAMRMSYKKCILSCWALSLADAYVGFSPVQKPSRIFETSRRALLDEKVGSWEDIETQLGEAYYEKHPNSIDSVLNPSKPEFSTERPTFFRERHGWCPYSERVWLALELAGVEYDTIRIDNTGHGPRPSYYSGQTPQMKWPEGRTQGESMDLVEEIDRRFCAGSLQCDSSSVQKVIQQFSKIFPRARPSSRAAYLFQYNGEPLWKSTFEETLQNTDELLSQTEGPFFCGLEVTAADIAWAPFLERYRYQLPCLHQGLDPANPSDYPHLAKWYEAMDRIPEYACRVKGNASSWRKVLTMAGFGNAGVPTEIKGNMDDLVAKEETIAQECIDLDVWKQHASKYPYVASTPYLEVASIITRNHEAICQDIIKQSGKPAWNNWGLPDSLSSADLAIRKLVKLLIDGGDINSLHPGGEDVGVLATFLDERMCVPRDMGFMSAAVIKNLSVQLRTGS